MKAEIVSVGTELLLGQIVDTNAATLGKALAELGITVHKRVTVGDNRERLLAALRESIEHADFVFTIGGLGPTQDDITRDVLAEAMDVPLQFDEGIAARLRSFFESRGLPVLESQMRQAFVPASGRALDNPNGTAPGLLFESRGKIAIALPGPPGEFVPILENEVVPYLRSRVGGTTIRSRVVRVCGMGEAMVEDRVKDLMTGDNPTVAPYAKTGEVHLRVTARAEGVAAAEALIEPVVQEIAARLGSHVYAYDDEPLEAAVVRMLHAAGMTLATAESCTGGLLAKRITDVPGSSSVFLGGVVAYSNDAKSQFLTIPARLIEMHGAVSREVAEAMAQQCRTRLRASIGVGITGIAGPTGGTAQKPVGLVWMAIASDGSVQSESNVYIGTRQDIRTKATQTVLTKLRDLIAEKA
ncbi:MAG: competence/damage-inducible protein A [Chthonomonadales bacterium]|nr:competence/damage-inducible protein A [Chthonomonadales bacterium]